MSAILSLRGVSAGYGPVDAISDVSLKVEAGRVTALLGSNGAGKTTTMMAISGLLKLRSGEVLLDGKPVRKHTNEAMVSAGIVQVPQGRQVFGEMSVRENLLTGAFMHRKGRPESLMDSVLDQFPRLRERMRQSAGTLSGGEQQMLAIGRALMSRPRVLLLDEPSLGLAPVVVDQMYAYVRNLVATGMSVLLAEQSVGKALSVASDVCLLRNGQVFAAGPVEELRHSDLMAEAYLT